VYNTGARNFLFLSVPPVNLAPLTLSKDDDGYSVKAEGEVILDWNERLSAMVTQFQANHTGVKVSIHDTYGLFKNVIEDPKSYEQTAGLKNVTAYCPAYKE
jgi:phospholipase/lecithinase/hemolysin